MNPILRHLGFSPTDRLVVFHADDIGSCHSSVAAYAELIEFGLLSSAATMVPCGWFPATAAYCREFQDRHLAEVSTIVSESGGLGQETGPSNPGVSSRIDMGVHLTLTSEWNTVRWGPIGERGPATGLVDREGYFHRRAPEVDAHAGLAAVEAELRSQIERALAAGIDITHIDTHMLTLWQPRLAPLYVRLAADYGVPPFLPRVQAEVLEERGADSAEAVAAEAFVRQCEEQGVLLFDHWHVMSLQDPDDRLGQAKRVLDALEPGLTNFIVHPGMDTPELRAMAPDWRCRVADFALFTSDAWRQAVVESGIQVIGFRTLRDALRTRNP